MKRKKSLIWTIFLVVLSTIFLLETGIGVASPEYPTHPIEVVVPWGAGGTTDIVARVFVQILEEQLGQPMPIQNKSGASGAVGSQYVLDKEADGYTILFSAESPGVMQTMGTADIGFHDFDPIILLVGLIPTLTVSADAPWDTIEEFVQEAEQKPGELIAAYAGPGTTGHIASLLFEKYSNLKFTNVPFGDGGKVVTALLGGHADLQFAPLNSVIEQYRAGSFKLLSLFTNEPVKGMEEITPVGQAIPSFQEYMPWGPMMSLLVKKGTPVDALERLKVAAAIAIQDERWLEFSESICGNNLGYQDEEFWNYVDKWTSVTSWLLYDAGAAQNSPADFNIPKPE